MKTRIYLVIGLITVFLCCSSIASHAFQGNFHVNQINPYVMAYINSDEYRDTSGCYQLQSKDEIRMATITALNSFYKNDVQVQDIMSKYINNNELLDKVTQIENQSDNIEVQKHIVKLLSGDLVKNTTDRRVLNGYIKRYALSSDDNEIIDYYHSINSGNMMIRSVYNGYNARVYAINNYDEFPSSYPNCSYIGGDCANFISQCMLAGGFTMQSDWYCYKLNSTYPAPQSPAQLDFSWDLADPSPWISVVEWTDYWNSSLFNTYSRDYYISNHTSIYDEPIYLGDLVVFHTQFLWIYTPVHMMIISYYDTGNEDFKLSGHTNPRLDYQLLTALAENTSYKRIKFFCP